MVSYGEFWNWTLLFASVVSKQLTRYRIFGVLLAFSCCLLYISTLLHSLPPFSLFEPSVISHSVFVCFRVPGRPNHHGYVCQVRRNGLIWCYLCVLCRAFSNRCQAISQRQTNILLQAAGTALGAEAGDITRRSELSAEQLGTWLSWSVEPVLRIKREMRQLEGKKQIILKLFYLYIWGCASVEVVHQDILKSNFSLYVMTKVTKYDMLVERTFSWGPQVSYFNLSLTQLHHHYLHYYYYYYFLFVIIIIAVIIIIITIIIIIIIFLLLQL